jgi:peptidoglycan/xylan/chitin deacetylase (PgdA/CDA1 family)
MNFGFNSGANIAKVNSLQTQVNKGEIISKRKRRTLISFHDDDMNDAVMEVWPAILVNRNIPVSFACPTGLIGTTGYCTWDNAATLVDLGAEIIGHGHMHRNLTTLTEEEVITEIATSKAILEAHGYNINNVMVYPGGGNNALVRRIARNYFRGAISGGAAGNTLPNTPPVNQYQLRNVSVTDPLRTLVECQALIDSADNDNVWLIFASHGQYFNENTRTIIEGIYDYADSKGVEIVSVGEGLNVFGNVIDLGDYTEEDDFFRLGCNGIPQSPAIGLDATINVYNFRTPITDYPVNAMTISYINQPHASEFPYPSNSGVLVTCRYGENGLDRQEYRPSGRNEIWVRTTDSNGNWSFFFPVTPIAGATGDSRPQDNYIGLPYFDATLSETINVKTAGVRNVDEIEITAGATQSGNITIRSTTIAVLAGDTAEEVATKIRASSFPGFTMRGSGTTCILTRYLAATVTTTTFTDIDGTGVTATITRTATGSATVWVDSMGGYQGTVTWDPGSLDNGAGETSVAITVTGAALGDFAMVAAPYDLQGITATAYVSAPNTVKIRLQNGTGGIIDLASGVWKVKVIKYFS